MNETMGNGSKNGKNFIDVNHLNESVFPILGNIPCAAAGIYDLKRHIT
jgi:hypothetical protein